MYEAADKLRLSTEKLRLSTEKCEAFLDEVKKLKPKSDIVGKVVFLSGEETVKLPIPGEDATREAKLTQAWVVAYVRKVSKNGAMYETFTGKPLAEMLEADDGSPTITPFGFQNVDTGWTRGITPHEATALWLAGK